MKDADVTPAEVFRALKELALALEAAGDIEAAQASAREALSAAKSEKQRGQATDLLQRLRR